MILQSRILGSKNRKSYNKDIKKMANSNYGLIPHKMNHKLENYSFQSTHRQKNASSILNKNASIHRINSIQGKTRINSVASTKSLYEPYRQTYQQSKISNRAQIAFNKDQILLIAKQISDFFNNKSILMIFTQKLSELTKIKNKYDNKALPQKKSNQRNQLSLMNKIQELYSEKAKLKKDRKNMQKQINQLRQKINLLQNTAIKGKYQHLSENNSSILNQAKIIPNKQHSQSSKLHAMILKQSQLISMQNKEYVQTTQNLRRMVYVQAKGVEKSIKRCM